MKRILWVVSCIPLIGTAIALPFLPDTVPLHYDAAGAADRWGSKYESLLFPAVILWLALVIALLMKVHEKKARTASDEKARAGAASNARVIGIAGISLAAVFTVMQGVILYGIYRDAGSGAATQTVEPGRAAVLLFGIVLIVLGNFITKTRINGTVGFRVRWSMYNDNTWRKTNRFGACALIAAGVLTVLAAVLVKDAFTAAMIMLGLVILASTATMLCARRVYLQEIEAEKGEL